MFAPDYSSDRVVSLSPKLPPQNVEAEEAIIGGCLLDSDAIGRVSPILMPDAFYVKAHEIIYRAILDVYNRSQPPNMLTVSSRLKDLGQLEKIGGIQTISRLADNCLGSVNVDLYAQLVVQKWRRRQLIKVCQEIQQSCYDSSIEDSVLEQEATDRILLQLGTTQTTGLKHISEVMAAESDRLNEVIIDKTASPGIPCGFYDLDAMTKGFKPGQLIIEAGRPGMGKSVWAYQVGKHIARAHNVAAFSLEMTNEENFRRLWAAEAEQSVGAITAGDIAPNDQERLGLSLLPLSELNFWMDDTPNMSPAYIRNQCLLKKKQLGSLGLVIVDYLHLMASGDDANEARELGRITKAMKNLARELQCPILLLSQLNREVESRANKRPMSSDLRASGSIEQDADIIIMLYRDEYYNEETPDRGIAEVIITKHRNGPCGTVKLLFEPQFTRFRNLARF